MVEIQQPADTPVGGVESVNGQTGVVVLTTSDITEGSNLYFTDERAQDAVGNAVGTGLDYDDATGAITANISTGVAGGQTIYGGTAANEDLTIEGTSDATKTSSYVILQPNGGRVGIGTASPSGILHLAGQQPAVYLTDSLAANETVRFGQADHFFSLIGKDNAREFSVGYLTGNFGMQQTAPTANLHVTQPTAGKGTVSVSAGGTAWTGVSTQFLNTFKVGDTITSEGQTLTIATISSNTALTTNAVGAAISAKAYTLVGGDRFVVQGNGNVGIGTTGPAYKLELTGTASIAERTIAINATPMVYLPDQAAGAFANSLAIGNGMRLLSHTSAIQGQQNTAVGIRALEAVTTGYENTAVGYATLLKTNTGYYNTAIGTGAMVNNLSGTYNMALGRIALYNNSSGSSNMAVGAQALYENTIGADNSAVGTYALDKNTTGSKNTAVGGSAGYAAPTGIVLSTNGTCTFLGYFASSNVNALTNSTAIGAYARVDKSNQVVIGDEQVTETILRGSINVVAFNDEALFINDDMVLL